MNDEWRMLEVFKVASFPGYSQTLENLSICNRLYWLTTISVVLQMRPQYQRPSSKCAPFINAPPPKTPLLDPLKAPPLNSAPRRFFIYSNMQLMDFKDQNFQFSFVGSSYDRTIERTSELLCEFSINVFHFGNLYFCQGS